MYLKDRMLLFVVLTIAVHLKDTRTQERSFNESEYKIAGFFFLVVDSCSFAGRILPGKKKRRYKKGSCGFHSYLLSKTKLMRQSLKMAVASLVRLLASSSFSFGFRELGINAGPLAVSDHKK